MFNLSYNKKHIVEESQQVNAISVINNYLLDRKQQKDSKKVDMNSEEQVSDLLKEAESNITINLRQNEGVGREPSYSTLNNIKFMHTKSNLGRGFIFWFMCNLCNKKKRYLYFPPNSEVLACRTCHNLSYQQRNESKSYRNIIL